MAVKAPSFVPIQIGGESGGTADGRSSSTAISASPKGLRVFEKLNGARIRIESGRGTGDAFDGSVGASKHPVIALRSDLKWCWRSTFASRAHAVGAGERSAAREPHIAATSSCSAATRG